MRYTLGIMVAAVIVSTALVNCANAADKPGDESGGKAAAREDHMFNDLTQALNLTPEQQEKLLAKRQAQQTSTAELREKIRAARQAMKQEFEKETPDRAALERMNEEIKGYVCKTMDLRFEGMITTKEVLTPEQFKKMGEIMEAQHAKRAEGLRERFRKFKDNRLNKDGNVSAKPASQEGE